MKSSLLIIILILASFGVFSQQNAPKPYGLIPSERQLKWHETEFYAIIHFTPTTFENKEWGYGDANPSTFNPSGFNADQIVSAAKSAGMRGIVFVCKHHDGFCLWPTKTTPYNISKSPWKNGQGDMVREMRDACDRHGLKFGAYISPWDRNHPDYGTPKYLEVYREQLRELYTNYGKLFMSWHDGANGGDGYYGGKRETRTIDRTHYYDWDNTWAITRQLQPEACLFSDIGWDVRWVGNEEGFAGETCWATFTPKGRENESKPGNGDSRYWEATEGHRDGKYWLPAECDVPLRPGWFYHPEQDNFVKTPARLFDLYCKSVGRGQALDLGLCPDKRGILHENDVAALKDFGELLKKTFTNNLAKKGKIKLSNVRGNDTKNFGVKNLLDNDRYSYWATDDAVTTPELIVEFHKPVTFNILKIRENIKLGQRIDEIGLDVWENNSWKEVGKASSIGAQRIIRLPFYQTTIKVRLRIVKAAASPCISEFGLYVEPLTLSAPVITRTVDGMVQLSLATAVHSIRYTSDGSEPSLKSAIYRQPFELANGGIIKAACFDAKGNKGETKVKEYGLMKKNWDLLSCSFAGDWGEAHKAFDENEESIWHTNSDDPAKSKPPHEIAINLGSEVTIAAFTLLPRQDKKTGGLINRFQFFISNNQNTWLKVAEGEFANIKANPLEQTVTLENPVTARYIKLVAVESIDNTYVSVSEIGVKLAKLSPSESISH